MLKLNNIYSLASKTQIWAYVPQIKVALSDQVVNRLVKLHQTSLPDFQVAKLVQNAEGIGNTMVFDRMRNTVDVYISLLKKVAQIQQQMNENEDDPDNQGPYAEIKQRLIAALADRFSNTNIRDEIERVNKIIWSIPADSEDYQKILDSLGAVLPKNFGASQQIGIRLLGEVYSALSAGDITTFVQTRSSQEIASLMKKIYGYSLKVKSIQDSPDKKGALVMTAALANESDLAEVYAQMLNRRYYHELVHTGGSFPLLDGLLVASQARGSIPETGLLGVASQAYELGICEAVDGRGLYETAFLQSKVRWNLGVDIIGTPDDIGFDLTLVALLVELQRLAAFAPATAGVDLLFGSAPYDHRFFKSDDVKGLNIKEGELVAARRFIEPLYKTFYESTFFEYWFSNEKMNSLYSRSGIAEATIGRNAYAGFDDNKILDELAVFSNLEQICHYDAINTITSILMSNLDSLKFDPLADYGVPKAIIQGASQGLGIIRSLPHSEVYPSAELRAVDVNEVLYAPADVLLDYNRTLEGLPHQYGRLQVTDPKRLFTTPHLIAPFRGLIGYLYNLAKGWELAGDTTMNALIIGSYGHQRYVARMMEELGFSSVLPLEPAPFPSSITSVTTFHEDVAISTSPDPRASNTALLSRDVFRQMMQDLAESHRRGGDDVTVLNTIVISDSDESDRAARTAFSKLRAVGSKADNFGYTLIKIDKSYSRVTYYLPNTMETLLEGKFRADLTRADCLIPLSDAVLGEWVFMGFQLATPNDNLKDLHILDLSHVANLNSANAYENFVVRYFLRLVGRGHYVSIDQVRADLNIHRFFKDVYVDDFAKLVLAHTKFLMVDRMLDFLTSNQIVEQRRIPYDYFRPVYVPIDFGSRTARAVSKEDASRYVTNILDFSLASSSDRPRILEVIMTEHIDTAAFTLNFIPRNEETEHKFANVSARRTSESPELSGRLTLDDTAPKIDEKPDSPGPTDAPKPDEQ